MNLKDRIADERYMAAMSALDDLCIERETEIRNLTCELAEEKAENNELRNEIARLNERLDKMRQTTEQDYEAWKEEVKSLKRQLKGCDMCAKTDCPERNKAIASVPMCEDLELIGEAGTGQ